MPLDIVQEGVTPLHTVWECISLLQTVHECISPFTLYRSTKITPLHPMHAMEIHAVDVACMTWHTCQDMLQQPAVGAKLLLYYEPVGHPPKLYLCVWC